MDWRWEAAISEGWRNWVSGRWVSIIVTLLAIVAVALPATADALVTARIARAEQVWIDSGGRVLIATNELRGVDAALCERLRLTPGVDAAAAVTRLPDLVGTAVAPGADLSVTTATAGISGLLRLAHPIDGIVIGQTITDRIGAGESVTLLPRRNPTTTGDPTSGPTDVPAGPWHVSAIADLSVLGEAYAYGVILPTLAHGPADACYIRAAPGQTNALRDALPAIFGSTITAPTVVEDRLIGGAFSRDYVVEYRERPTAWLAIASGAALGAMWLLLRWVRRGQDSLYATVGAGTRTRGLIRMTEWALTLAVGTILGLVSATCVVMITTGQPETLPLIARSTVIVGAVSSAIALVWVTVPQREILTTLKDR